MNDEILRKLQTGDYANLTNDEKKAIINAKRTDKMKLANTQLKFQFGNSMLGIKALKWTDSNKFEDKIAEVVGKFGVYSVKEINDVDLTAFVTTILGILREDLIELANIATNGLITEEYIIQEEATKDEVIRIVVESFKLNYSYLKNAFSLANKLR